MRILGYVDDVEALLAAADLGVNPITSTDGASVKMLTFAAAGLPVVATPEGARGLPPELGVRVASPDGFARAVAAMLAAPRVAPPRPPNWAEVTAPLLAAYERLHRRRAATPGPRPARTRAGTAPAAAGAGRPRR